MKTLPIITGEYMRLTDSWIDLVCITDKTGLCESSGQREMFDYHLT